MAKVSPVSIKYMVTADFTAEGPVDKPDVVGALFGQTEGLLGSDMELRELQKEGKIGRIEVELDSEGGKTVGEIKIPSALNKAETAIIAAALETIDKIGPTDAKITITGVNDVRGTKRDYIMDRAKQLLEGINSTSKESGEMGQELRESSRISKLNDYGEEKLPAGDLSGNEVIVVEGRADVVNLLKHGITNVIGMNGTKLPKEIAKLGEQKELTLFVDGDRGGKLIARNVCDNAKVVYIANAPDGKEVEELAGKEVIMALRKKVSAREFFERSERSDRFNRFERPAYHEERETSVEASKQSDKKLTSADVEKIKKLSENLGSKNILFLSPELEVIRDIPMSKARFINISNVFVVVVQNATSMALEAAEEFGAKYLAAKVFGRVESSKVELVSI